MCEPQHKMDWAGLGFYRRTLYERSAHECNEDYEYINKKSFIVDVAQVGLNHVKFLCCDVFSYVV